MEYKATIVINGAQLDAYNLMFDYGEKELIQYGIPRLDNIKSWTAEFGDGCVADIKINASEDDVWSEGVLFDDRGCELTHTEVRDTLEGEWRFNFDGDDYIVNVTRM